MTDYVAILIAGALADHGAGVAEIVEKSLTSTYPSDLCFHFTFPLNKIWHPREFIESGYFDYSAMLLSISALAYYYNQGLDFSNHWWIITESAGASFHYNWSSQGATNINEGSFIYTHPDTGNSSFIVWDGSVPLFRPGYSPSYVAVENGCGNPGYYMINVTGPVYSYTERNQTVAIKAAISSPIDLSYSIRALVASNTELPLEIYAAIAENFDLTYEALAAIQGPTENGYNIRAAIKSYPELALAIDAAVAMNPELLYEAKATICDDVDLLYEAHASVKGDTDLQYGIKANILVDRLDEIKLELEGWFPQEFALNSTPNYPSSPRDSRTEMIG